MKARTALRGLRFRLMAAFVLVATVSALGTGALTFREARTGALQQGQDTVVNQFRDNVDALASGITLPLDQQQLDTLVAQVARSSGSQGWRVMATYRNLSATSPQSDPFDELTPELRASARQRPFTVFQRVVRDHDHVLVVGMPVTYGADQGTDRSLSGLTLYLAVSQDTLQTYVDALIGAVERATVPALALAILAALLAARGVLRPVRALRSATRSMAEGRLDTRLAVNGADELADLSRSFNETAAALEKSVTELRQMEAQARRFAADVSHELRTPLAAMSAVTDVLNEDATHLEGDTASAVWLISEETARLAALVNDLLEMSRFDAGAIALNLDEIDLGESLQRTLASRGWLDQVDTDLPAAGTVRGLVDPRRLDIIVANLTGNALQHGARPVVLGLAQRTGDDGRGWVVIVVEDSGPGIPDAAMPHIFDRFYKANTARSRSGNSGLGLAITAENVRLHGGTLRAANNAHGGATFTVELPLRRDRTEEAAPAGKDTRS